MPFEWSEAKALSNLQKHGVSFVEAATVFDDPLAGVVDDPDYSDAEERYVILGCSSAGRLLAVVYSERGAARQGRTSYGQTYPHLS